MEALDELRRYVSRNEYSTEVTIDQDNLDDVQCIADEHEWIYVEERHLDEFDVPASVTIRVTIDLDEWRNE
jgi:hypothetical protein